VSQAWSDIRRPKYLHEPTESAWDTRPRVELLDFVHEGDGAGDKVFVYAVPTPDGGADCVEVRRPNEWVRGDSERRSIARVVGRREPRGAGR
jgi:hypothetical protein